MRCVSRFSMDVKAATESALLSTSMGLGAIKDGLGFPLFKSKKN